MMKRIIAILYALLAFVITFFLVAAVFGQNISEISPKYTIFANIAPLILPLAIGIMTYQKAMKPSHSKPDGFPVIMKNPPEK